MKKNLLTGIIAIISLVLIPTAKAQIINIPDANFKAALVANSSINTNADAEIDSTEAASYTGAINVSSLGISTLTGIEAFTSFTILNADGNSITTLDLTSNTALTYAYLNSNGMTSLNVDSLPNLATLHCAYNMLTSLDVTSLSTLTYLACPGNQLTTLDLSHNYSLGHIDCSDNQLSCLDLSANWMLTYVDCSDNLLLTKLNLKNFFNTNISLLNAIGDPIVCFQVDDVAYASSNWYSYVDPGVTFNTDCGQPTTVLDNTPVGCLTTPITFDQTSTNFDSFIWYFGDGDTTTVVQDPVHTYPYGGNFYVQLFVKNCYGTVYADTDIVIGNSIWGYIDHSGGPLGDGEVLLLKYEPFYTSFDTVAQYTGFEVAGWYGFNYVTEGLYQIKVYPNLTLDPNLVPTYSGNTSNWESATTINHGCFSEDSMFITMLELPLGLTGPGALSGEIIEGPGFGRAQGDPIHGVDVKLGITGSSQIVDCTTTDTLGEYTFVNLPVGDYTIYAEIPGLFKDSSYQITIDSTNMIWTYLDYQVDSNSIDIIGNIGFETIEDDQIGLLGVYPNPVKDQATILYNLKADAAVKIEIYNMYGVKVQSLADTESASGEHLLTFNPKLANLKSGIYFITLTANGKSRTARVVIME